MADRRSEESERSTAGVYRRLRWDAIAAIIAALIGLLALLVSGYTAYMQRQQVRAQVWPHLQIAWSDTRQSLLALNKGVGPAIVRSVVVRVDGKTQRDWTRVLKALGVSANSIGFGQSTLNGTVLSPGETLPILVIPDKAQFHRFRGLAGDRMDIRACFCSTLGDCWKSSLDMSSSTASDGDQSSATCPRVSKGSEFQD